MHKKIKSFLNKFGFHVEPHEQVKVFDVVCGMEVSLARIKHTITYNKEQYHFCSDSCRDHFKRDPQKYAGS